MKYLFALLISLCSSVHAATWTKDTGWVLEPGPDGKWTVLPGSGGTSPNSVTCSSGNCSAGGSRALPGVRPATPFSPSSPFAKGGIARGVAGLAGRALPWVSVGMAVYDWYNDAGIDLDESNNPGGFDNAQTAVSTWQYVADGSTYSLGWGNFASSGAVAVRIMSETSLLQSNYIVRYTSPPSWGVDAGCGVSRGCYCMKPKAGGAETCGYGAPWPVRRNPLAQTSCAQASDGRIVGLATAGLCPQGAFVPYTPDQVQTKLENAPITDEKLARAVREVWDNGGSIDDAGLPTVSGPTSVTGPTTTTTRSLSNGTTEVSTTQNNYNITYNNNQITINESKVTTNPDGSTVTETKAQEDKPDDCSMHPNSLGCAELGSADGAPTWDTKNVVYTPEELGFAGACPAPWTASVRGWNLTMSYQPACDVAPQVRAGVLALAALAALMLIINAVRS